jgi:tetratricopeptide (TPR) repeat protein
VVVSKVDEAEPFARRVLDACRRALGPAHPQTLESMTALAHVLVVKHHKVIIAEARRYRSGVVPGEVLAAKGPAAMREAQDLLERSYGGQVRLLGPAHPAALETLDALGWLLNLEGDFAGSEFTLRQASEARCRVLGPAHPDTLRSLKSLGVTLFRLGRTDEATRLLLEVAEGHRQTFGPTHIQTSSALGVVLDKFRLTNNGTAMRDFCQRWLREILASPVDPDPYQRDRRGITLEKLALQVVMLPEPVPFDAELVIRAVREAVALDEQSDRWSFLGVVLDRTGRHQDAIQAFQTATTRPDWKGGRGFHWFGLARLRARAGDLSGASECYERGLLDQKETWIDLLHFLRDEAATLLCMHDLPAEVFARP